MTIQEAARAEHRVERTVDVPQERLLRLARSDATALKLFLAGLLFTRLATLATPLTDTTEARYAEIARKMLETGDWITPQFAYGVPFWGKPPLHTWLSAWGMGVFGVNEPGARIAILALAAMLVALLARWCAAQAGRDVALASAAALAGAGLFWVASAAVMTDLVMTAATTLAMAGFWSASRTGQPSRLGGYLLFAAIGVGMLAKGPVAVVLTALPIGAWALAMGRIDSLRQLPWLGGLALAALITGPWYIAAEMKTPGFLEYFLIGEHLQRFMDPGWRGDLYGSGHAEPRGMIWLFWLLAFMPWPVLGLALIGRAGAIVRAFRADAHGWRLYLLLWASAPMVFFTPAANIIIPYVLPGLPAAAILLIQLGRDGFGATPNRVVRRAVGATMALALAVYATAGALSLAAPDLLAVKSQRSLVRAASEAAPDAALNILGKRSYSAEFYTRGGAVRLPGAADIPAMLANGRRDALSIPLGAEAQLPPGALEQLRRVGDFGRRTLYIEYEAATR